MEEEENHDADDEHDDDDDDDDDDEDEDERRWMKMRPCGLRGTRQAATDPERRRPWRRLRGADRRAGGPRRFPGTGQQADA